MERTFTQDVGTRFKKGDVRDYSDAVWAQIAKNVKKPLDKFTRRGSVVATMVVKGDKAATMADTTPPAVTPTT